MKEETVYSDKGDSHSETLQRLQDIEAFVSKITREKDLVSIAKATMKMIAEQFGITEMILALWDDESRRFKLLASYGYPTEAEKEFSKYEYSHDWISVELQEKFRIADDIYFINAEDWEPVTVDELLLDRKEAIDEKRNRKDQWLEKDFFEFVLRDHSGEIIGALEMNDMESDSLPDYSTLLSISIYTKIASIMMETARAKDSQEEVSRRIDGLVALMSHDVGKKLENIQKICETIRRPSLEREYRDKAVREVLSSIERSKEINDKVQKLRNIESRPYSLFVLVDIMSYINKSVDKFKKKHDGFDVNVSSNQRSIYLKCDPSIEELISASLDAVKALKKDNLSPLIIEVSQSGKEGEIQTVDLTFASRDIDPIGWRKLANDLRTSNPKSRRLPPSGDLFGKYLIGFISRKYGGTASVEEIYSKEKPYRGALRINIPIL
ncbi:MAG TPA: hypothetical protein ENN25_04355 [Euryarchaeota archaeon]|nr:hypothetical protein [Euryarchaeota archaeon]